MEKKSIGQEKGNRSELTVKMFGKFQVENEKGILNKENMRSEMLTRLLAYMISRREKDMTAQELIDVLWPDDQSDNPAGALKNLMYRLRKLMSRTWGDGGKYIVTGRGAYQLNPEFVFHIDIEEFEECCRQVFNSEDPAVQQENGKRAVELYQGMFLSELSSEYWVVSIATYYHSIYLTMVKKLAALLEKEKKFTDVEEICGKAIQIEPLDEEIHCFLLRAMIADNKQQLAASHYKETVKLLYDSLGVRPSGEMESIYEELQKIQHDHESNIDIIQEDLREEKASGAFFCEYGVFRKIYALESRSSRRLGISVHLALVSLYLDFQIQKDDQDYTDLIGVGMSVLEETLMKKLRSSDIVCRYSVNQFLVMLPACQYEDAKMVVNRLKDSFYRSGKTGRLLLQYSIDELDVD
ncbi:MAG: BTAD domain-containing putative transcriptional regulator [Blautia sp.]|uniref:BTAD domain-containing putative transcriptional regulator n=1 Tax=Blautia sp. TaxID=1955243 RepID=UPI002A75B98B|nr:BTAD domain-containing putative transcriptional regulator [Blautia sp.]MDY3016012.1 BTAD domain-containing putative transcriptional regulator [Blautia sp.]